MLLYRIGTKHFNGNALQAFSGNGGLYGVGRWHNRGRPIVYVASSLALATLEILAHINRAQNIGEFVSWTIEVPENLVERPVLPTAWSENLEISRAFGDAWLQAKTSVALIVPSVIVPSENNVLLNPLHADFDVSWIRGGPFAVKFDPRHIDPATIKS